MTPCEKLGYKVGDKFEVTEDSTFPNSSFHCGEIVYLGIDDGSNSPYFISEDKQKRYVITLRKVKKITTDTDGWIKWEGGECPVEKGTLVDVKYRDGRKKYSLPAMEQIETPDAKRVYWINHSMGNDIIAYRLSDADRLGSEPAEDKTTNNADGFAIVNLISSVCPALKVEDALEIASTLIDAGFKR